MKAVIDVDIGIALVHGLRESQDVMDGTSAHDGDLLPLDLLSYH